jgi:hypothetical protein
MVSEAAAIVCANKRCIGKKVKVPEISNSAGVKGSPAKASDLVGDANGLSGRLRSALLSTKCV